MALEFGSGTQADPWLLINYADVYEMIANRQFGGGWFALVADLDVSATKITYASGAKLSFFNIDGRGFTLRLSIQDTYSTGLGCFYRFNGGVWKDLNIVFVGIYRFGFYISSTNPLRVENTRIEISPSPSNDTDIQVVNAINSLIIAPKKMLANGSAGSYKDGGSELYATSTSSFSDGNKFNKTNYPTLDERKWIFDGISLPRPRQQTTVDLTTRYGIKGQTKVGGNNRQRNLAVFTENGLRYKVQETKADGSFFLNLNDISTPVTVLVYEDIGAKAALNTAYSLNQIIHPATPNGFRYRCTLAGNSGATIPPEPWSTTTVLTIGAAKFTPEPVYEPKAHGPLLPVLFNVVTEQPV
ncbi:TPA: hypothetical protein ACSP27_000788 [Aeromonas veronii]